MKLKELEVIEEDRNISTAEKQEKVGAKIE